MMKRAPLWNIFWLFLATRLILLLTTYFGFIFLTEDKYASTAVDIPTFLSFWNHWDAAIYVRIAQSGYNPPLDLAFFPLFPLLISAISHVLGDWSYLLVGMLLSNAALFGALVMIYHLANDILGEHVARRTLLYLCIFPTAFFFFAAYNESLFLFLTVGTFLALRRQRWWLAGFLGFLASLTRTTGPLLAIPYLYELWMARDTITATRRKLISSLAPIIIIPLGLLAYSVYCWISTGNPLAFASVQSHWARHFTFPWQGIFQAFFEFFWNQPFGSFYQVHVLLDLSATLGFILLAFLGRNRLRPSYTLWIALLILTMLLSSTLEQHDSLISNQRFVLEMFPGFITLAALGIKYPRFHQLLLYSFPMLLATLSLLFVLNKWMV